ncbi:MAG: ACT domain-containing protein [Chloroflexota bacterium]|nr:ACT domain-containing protein [Chloroflexota bacterium]
MKTKQVSVFVSNEPGRLVGMLKPLSENGINIHALSVADSTDFGIVRMVVSDTEAAVKALHQAEYTVRVNEVLQYEMPNVPGGLLTAVVEPLADAGINVEYFYAFTESDVGKARVVLKVNDVDAAERVLRTS